MNTSHTLLRRALFALGLVALLHLPPLTFAQDLPPESVIENANGHHSHGHAPVGVMGGHVHRMGELMFSYRYMAMNMDGNRDGRNRRGRGRVLQQFPVTPLSMRMDMHMFSAMYAVSDQVTLMAMLPYVRKSMDHVTGTGVRFTTHTQGVGDIRVSGLFSLWSRGCHRVHGNLGVSLPTGAVNERDATPANPNAKLPYPMQLGSGTYDLLPGVTYSGHSGAWTWGSQLSATLPLEDENSEDYRLGEQVRLTAWGNYQWTHWFSSSLRIDAQAWTNIHGADPDLNPAMISTADPDRRAGQRVDLLVGFELLGPEAAGALKGHRLGVEWGIPIYQWLDGPQLEVDWVMTAGWSYVW